MVVLKQIVCAIDFNQNSMAALHIARRLGEQNRAKLLLIHVVRPTDPLMISAPIVAQRRYDDARRQLTEIGCTETTSRMKQVF